VLSWSLHPIGASSLAWASYRNSVAAAVRYGEALAVAFDLHRFDLYGALRVPEPVDLAHERALNHQITNALWVGGTGSLAYKQGRPS
jgi:hypothetical protein